MQREFPLTITCEDDGTAYNCMVTWDTALGERDDHGERFLVLDDCYVESIRHPAFCKVEHLEGRDAWVEFICMRGFRFFRDALREAVESDMT